MGVVSKMKGFLVILTFLCLTECSTNVGYMQVIHADNTCMSDLRDCVFNYENKLDGNMTLDDRPNEEDDEPDDENSHIIKKRSVG